MYFNRAIPRHSLKYLSVTRIHSLAPVLRGEGWGEGLLRDGVDCGFIPHPQPLEYRGEGKIAGVAVVPLLGVAASVLPGDAHLSRPKKCRGSRSLQIAIQGHRRLWDSPQLGSAACEPL